jgi:NAD(P)-dependent dehydrogenase (short-subunit alcohol dehydrogenase family)
MLFSSRGWNVVATVRKPDDGRRLTDLKSVRILCLDVQDSDSIGNAVKYAIGHFGQIDVVVNNAGYSLFSLFEPASREAIQRQFDVNVFGAMDVIRVVLPHFRAKPRWHDHQHQLGRGCVRGRHGIDILRIKMCD